MSTSFYLKFGKAKEKGTEINGSSQAAHHPRWVELESFSYGWSSRVLSPAVAKPDQGSKIHDLALTTADGAASAKIFLACAVGSIYETATLETVHGDQVVLAMTMKVVAITSCSTSGSRDDSTPLMSFSLNFSSIEAKYLKASTATPTPPSGAPPAPGPRKY